VENLWQTHRVAPFPTRLTSVDIAGIEMVTLDADVAGCVSTRLATGGPLDDHRWHLLATRERHLEQVLSELTGEEALYFQRVYDMTVLLLNE
jgi:hypothetical protein